LPGWLPWLPELLHPAAHGFEPGKRLLQILIVAAGTLARFAGLRGVGSLRLLQLIAQIIQAHRHIVFAQPGLRAVALANVLAVLAHVHFEIVLLRLTERFAQFGASGVLCAGHAARGVRHALLQLLELVGQIVLFAGQCLGLLLILETG
jgi:hypothetical protein